jgi:hypothetical protein
VRFLQLDLRPLPATPSLAAVFPYLRETVESIGGVDVTNYAMAFVVPPGNGLLRLVLDSILVPLFIGSKPAVLFSGNCYWPKWTPTTGRPGCMNG